MSEFNCQDQDQLNLKANASQENANNSELADNTLMQNMILRTTIDKGEIHKGGQGNVPDESCISDVIHRW